MGFDSARPHFIPKPARVSRVFAKAREYRARGFGMATEAHVPKATGTHRAAQPGDHHEPV